MIQKAPLRRYSIGRSRAFVFDPTDGMQKEVKIEDVYICAYDMHEAEGLLENMLNDKHGCGNLGHTEIRLIPCGWTDGQGGRNE